MCASSESHVVRRMTGSGADSPVSPIGNGRDTLLPVPTPRRRGSRAVGGSINGENIFRQSDAGTASVSASRADTFPEVRLGLGSGGERGNILVP